MSSAFPTSHNGSDSWKILDKLVAFFLQNFTYQNFVKHPREEVQESTTKENDGQLQISKVNIKKNTPNLIADKTKQTKGYKTENPANQNLLCNFL